ncbi:DUF6950 family protein [Aestuariivirga litoralis]|uniref:DUF6950 family protein n=1 Tax=Aestuariivirga litoralis TaxID=2650924 RepID=UPI0018C5C1BC|nr:hypothetical protein [Aestuariivirga litoralis]MBG1232969.1 hypothetical protein [Aestuariivirga litoralis]
MDAHIVNAACAQALSQPMQWGVDDCCKWVANIIQQATGKDLMEGIAPYGDRYEALQVIREYGGHGLHDAAIKMAALHGFPELRAPFSGDLFGLVPLKEEGFAIGLFFEGKWLCRNETGVTVLPPDHCLVAWRFM